MERRYKWTECQRSAKIVYIVKIETIQGRKEKATLIIPRMDIAQRFSRVDTLEPGSLVDLFIKERVLVFNLFHVEHKKNRGRCPGFRYAFGSVA